MKALEQNTSQAGAKSSKTHIPSRKPPKRLRRWFTRFLLMTIWLLVVGGGGVIYLLRSTPADYKQFTAYRPSMTEQEFEQAALGVEDQFASALSAPTASGSSPGQTIYSTDGVDNTTGMNTANNPAPPVLLYVPR